MSLAENPYVRIKNAQAAVDPSRVSGDEWEYLETVIEAERARTEALRLISVDGEVVGEPTRPATSAEAAGPITVRGLVIGETVETDDVPSRTLMGDDDLEGLIARLVDGPEAEAEDDGSDALFYKNLVRLGTRGLREQSFALKRRRTAEEPQAAETESTPTVGFRMDKKKEEEKGRGRPVRFQSLGREIPEWQQNIPEKPTATQDTGALLRRHVTSEDVLVRPAPPKTAVEEPVAQEAAHNAVDGRAEKSERGGRVRRALTYAALTLTSLFVSAPVDQNIQIVRPAVAVGAEIAANGPAGPTPEQVAVGRYIEARNAWPQLTDEQFAIRLANYIGIIQANNAKVQ